MTDYTCTDIAAKKIIERLGKTIVIAVPLGIGKPIGLLNALYRLAENDPSIHLTIITGLTLARPLIQNELEKRLVEPILARLLNDYEDPLYEKARVLQKLPDHIKVIEFFLVPGKYLNNNYVQQNYISSSYTHVASDLLYYSVNVIAQQVAPSKNQKNLYSLSSNSDLFSDVLMNLDKSKLANKKIAIVAEVNAKLPFMLGTNAVCSSEIFTDIIDTGNYKALFAVPKEALSAKDHLIGLYASCLIKDDSCMQIGIGNLSNAVTNALIMRQNNNELYQETLKKLSVHENFGEIVSSVGAIELFNKGIYASTEMLSDDYMHLYKNSILKKKVYDHAGLQNLLNLQLIAEQITPQTLDILLENNIINYELTPQNIEFLIHFGVLKPTLSLLADKLMLESGEIIPNNLHLSTVKQIIVEKYLGDTLKTGKIIHAGFFIGTTEFYQFLYNLPAAELEKIEMTSITRTNSVLWSYELAKLQHQQARFINSAMMITLGGAYVSDGLKDLQEVSGVGGQFNFVNMATHLPNARSIILCHSTRTSKAKIKSNIVWDYLNITIPRYLRDIVVTEYGIADCRSKTDSEIIKAILNITDSRFQADLLKKAKKYGKLPENYHIPMCFQQNYPENVNHLIQTLQAKGFCKIYPFGNDLTEDEMEIKQALLYLKECSLLKIFLLICISLFLLTSDLKYKKYLLRMKLYKSTTLKEFFYKKLLIIAIRRSN